MRGTLPAVFAVLACASLEAQAQHRWTTSIKQGIEEHVIRAGGGARFIISCPSGLEKTNPGFTFESKKLKIAQSETRSVELILGIDAASHAYKVECSGDSCDWTSADAAGQSAIEKSVNSLRSAKKFVVRVPGLKVSEEFSTSGARKALENALDGCES